MKNDYPIPRNILDSFDIAGLMSKMAKADWYYDYTDDYQVWKRGDAEIKGIKEDLRQLSKLENGVYTANYLWDAYVPLYSVRRPEFLLQEVNTNLSLQNTTTMIENNYDYLSKQIKFTGFGEDHKETLKQKMTEGQPDFMLTHKQDFGSDSTVATLQFKKSEETGMYFFNRYNLMLQNKQHPDAIKQTFYINPKEESITLKEAYNLMSGRAVHKELANKEGEKYKAWIQLDFKETDKHGNYVSKQFHQNYGYDLQAVLAKHPIKELASETDKTRLMESLERGNRQSVTLEINGKEQKVFIEAAPQFKSLNFYETSGQRIRTDKLYENNSQEQTEKQDKKQSQKQTAGDDDGEPETGQKKTKRKRQSIT